MSNRSYPRVFIAACVLVAAAASVYVGVLVYDILLKPVLEVLPPFAIAFVFAFLMNPIVDWLEQRALSRGWAVAAVGLAFVIAFLLVGFLLVPQIVDQATQLARNLPSYARSSAEWIDRTLAGRKPLLESLHLPSDAGQLAKHFSKQLESAAASSLAFLANLLAGAVSKLLWIIVIPLSTLWLLKDYKYITAKALHLSPERYRQSLETLGNIVSGVFGRYIRGMAAVAVVYSVVSCIWLTAVRLDYALIIGSLSGPLYFLPYLGALVTILAVAVAAVASSHSAAYVFAVVAAMAVQNFIVFDLVITPRIVGRSVGLHPVLMLLALALGAKFFGVVGMILAVPLLAAAQAALGQYYPRLLENPLNSGHQSDESK
ncbi:MAG: AI-2E family transporter [Armatimonadota bacterium]|nr:AI-2E family transporter [Armatimonadota bacterium]